MLRNNHTNGIDIEAEQMVAVGHEFLDLDPLLDKAYVHGIIIGTITRARITDPNVNEITVRINSRTSVLKGLPREFIDGCLDGLMS